MASEKSPSRDEIMEELSKKGINNLVELLDALMPDEAGGYGAFDWSQLAEENFFKLGPRTFTLTIPDSAITGDRDHARWMRRRGDRVITAAEQGNVRTPERWT